MHSKPDDAPKNLAQILMMLDALDRDVSRLEGCLPTAFNCPPKRLSLLISASEAEGEAAKRKTKARRTRKNGKDKDEPVPKQYTLRAFMWDSGEVRTVGEPGQFSSAAGARYAARKYIKRPLLMPEPH